MADLHVNETSILYMSLSSDGRLERYIESDAVERGEHRRQEVSPPSLSDRLRVFTGGTWSGSLGEPTTTVERQYEIVAQEFGAILARLRQAIDVDLKRVEDAAEAAGVPWTSGRIPTWQP